MSYGLGIDLGTTFTAAAIFRAGRAEMIGLDSSSPVAPSVVWLSPDGDWVIGQPANHRGSSDPDRLAREFKRRLGDPAPLLLGGTPVPAYRLMGRVLAWVMATATEREGSAPDAITVTHPANWGAYRREQFIQTLDVGGAPGASVLTEPEAAAIDYASRERFPVGATVAVYDLGGGTFDAALVTRADEGFELVGRPQGLEALGGIDFDAALLDFVGEQVGGFDDLDDADPAVAAALNRLRADVVDAKLALSTTTEAVVPVLVPGRTGQIRVTRTEYEARIRPLLAETIEALDRTLTTASVTADDLHSVLLVGGASRTPLVGQLVAEALGRPVAVDTDPKHAVARGAALHAAGAVGTRTSSSEPGAATPIASAPATGSSSEARSAPRAAPGATTDQPSELDDIPAANESAPAVTGGDEPGGASGDPSQPGATGRPASARSSPNDPSPSDPRTDRSTPAPGHAADGPDERVPAAPPMPPRQPDSLGGPGPGRAAAGQPRTGRSPTLLLLGAGAFVVVALVAAALLFGSGGDDGGGDDPAADTAATVAEGSDAGDEPDGFFAAGAGVLEPDDLALPAVDGPAEVDVVLNLSGIELSRAQDALDEAFSGTDVTVRLSSSVDEAPADPDLVAVSYTQAVDDAQLADFVGLDPVVIDQIEANYEPATVALVSATGRPAGVPLGVLPGQLLWFRPDRLDELGVAVPDDFTAFGETLRALAADGTTPLCLGIESGAATGFVFTDWVEELLANRSSTTYAAWLRHAAPFDTPEAVTAAEDVVALWTGDGVVAGGADAIIETSFRAAGLPLIDDSCVFHVQRSFYKTFVRDAGGQVGRADADITVVPFPGSAGETMVASGSLIAPTNDDAATTAVLAELASTDFARAMAGAELITAHRGLSDADLDPFDALVHEMALTAAGLAPDASDAFPPEVGTGTFWEAAEPLVRGGNVAATFAAIEAGFP